MNKKNKNGFTLVELLAVIIVLIIIIFLAINKVNQSTKKTKNNTIKANALSYIKGIDQLIDEDALNSVRLKNKVLYKGDIDDLGIKISGTTPDHVEVFIFNFNIEYACIVYGKKYVTYEEGKVSEVKKGTCPDISSHMGVYTFEYTGSEEKFTFTKESDYKIEVWGAQGGSSLGFAGARGGYGGYSSGVYHFTEGQSIFINVGGVGENGTNNSTTKLGGYNGGGNKVSPDSAYYGSAGGGATHVALSSGLLSTFSSKVDDLIIVAGGGGGGAGISGNYGYGGSGGGFVGGNGLNFLGNVGWGAGGSQTAPGCYNTTINTNCGSFGQGNGTTNGHGGAGGGGFYGGGATNTANIGGGGGGSGYIGNPNLTEKTMYCYGCTENTSDNTRTYVTSCAEEEPTSQCAKIGNGYVKISRYSE